MLSINTPWHVQNWDCFGIILFYFFRGGNPWKRESWNLRLLWIFLSLFLWVATLGQGNPESWDCFGIFFGGVATLGKGSLEIWDCFGIIFFIFFWWQPLEKGVWRFEIALGLFFYIWWQPLEKGVWRFKIALGLFFLVATLGKGSLEIWDCFGIIIFFFGGNPWKKESGNLRLLWDYLSIFFFGGNPWKRESGGLRLLWDYFFLVATLGKGSLEIWDCFGIIIFFFGWQPLEKGIRRFEIALGLFFDFFGCQAFGKGSFSSINLW